MPTDRQVGIFDAKTHLSELIGEVEEGATLTITRRGVPVARIVPVPVDSDRAEAIHRLRAIAAEVRTATGSSFTVDELRDWRIEGRR